MRAIVCADDGWGIGLQGDLLVRISADLKRFKGLTMGKTVILGRKTLATFPGGKPLPGRRHLVLSRNPDFHPEGVEVYPDVESLLKAVEGEAYVIGGGQVYGQLLPYCDGVDVTRLDEAFVCDTWFPNLDDDPQWNKVSCDGIHEEHGVQFWYDTYERVADGISASGV